MRLTYRASEQDQGQRIVDVLILRTGMSRLMSKKVRLYGSLLLNGRPCRMIDRLNEGDLVTALYPADYQTPAIRDDQGIKILYRDEWVLVVSKPAGLLTHPSRHEQNDALTSRLSTQKLHPVNRLDRDTSGLVIIALNGHAHYVIAGKEQKKEYLAIVRGRFSHPTGLIQAPIKRESELSTRRIIDLAGSPAETRWQTLGYSEASDCSLILFQLITGRTHQIRLHSFASGHPIIGDPFYNDKTLKQPLLIERQMLHAWRISFNHPVDFRPLQITDTLPPDFQKALDYSGLRVFFNDFACSRS